jgi:ankyrin repeat protein
MELIKLPNVSLVAATGKNIGVYTEDPVWWESLEKRQKQQAEQSKKRLKNDNMANQSARAGNTRQENLNKFSEYLKVNEDRNYDYKAPLTDRSAKINAERETYECDVIGETPLHIAIMYNDLSTLMFLVEECGYEVNQRTVEKNFTPGFLGKIAVKSINNSQYESLAYFGEYPLALAACFSSKDIYDYLLSKGADPNLPDTNGNTVLHVLVINNRLVS